VTAKVVVYSTRFCGYCVMATRLLRKKGVDFEEIDVSADPNTRVWLRSVTGRQTVPQIFIDGRPVGGFDDLAALDRHGQLDALLFPEAEARASVD
jgi:glutaredoxin 3